MRVSVATCISTAVEMLDFSVWSLVDNAGTQDYDLIVVTWLPSDEVLLWLRDRPWIHHVMYHAEPSVGYVPNLRGLINLSFSAGYALNDWVAHTDSDVVYGPDWLRHLVEACHSEDQIVSSQHITPIKGKHVITADLGRVQPGEFDQVEFDAMVEKYGKPGVVETECQRGGWRNTATLPYIMHRKWWQRCGPWELTGVGKGVDPPDRRFFERCAKAGARFAMAMGSVAYHYEGGERRGQRPPGTEHLPEEGEVR